MASQPIYQFISELKDYEPKIRRRFQVAGNVTLARLGYIVMTMYEMKANHLFSVDYPVDENLAFGNEYFKFSPDNQRVHHYEIIDDEAFQESHDHRCFDATQRTLRQLSSRPGLILDVQYDFGDGWEVRLVLEDVIWDDKLPGKLLPRVLEGEGFGIIEDCGGPEGLAALAEAFKDKSNPEYLVLSSWLGEEDLDLSSFDLEDMNFRLKKVPRIYRDLYEYGVAPTKQSLSLLDRKYHH